jgi:RES domain-containing protein
MYLYRIVQNTARTNDLSGTGAFRVGGRWNSRGTHMLYTSENSSLALLENLVHFDKTISPPQLYIMQLELDDAAPIYELPDADYPPDWLTNGLIANQHIGDKWMSENEYIAIKVKSAVNVFEYNYLLNPLFPNFHSLVRVTNVRELDTDGRLVG